MKYAVEVARLGSISQAAEKLYIAQPNLSRCIKELEEDLDITIFERSPRGMTLTPEGEMFINYAAKILNQIDDVEAIFKGAREKRRSFSISVPRASYIADAFVQFSKGLDGGAADIYYMETNTQKTIENILEANYHLGVIRYPLADDEYFRRMLDARDLTFDVVADFKFVLTMSNECEVAKKEEIYFSDLSSLIEIRYGDPVSPSLLLSTGRGKNGKKTEAQPTIFLFERSGQFDILCENRSTYMWVSPLPEKLLKRYNLTQRKCADGGRKYRDILIRQKSYALSDLDRRFITELEAAANRMRAGLYEL